MTGVLMLESLTRGNTLKQGDKTPLTYRLLDADGDNLNVAGKTATVRLAHPNYLTIGYEKSGLTVSQDDTVTFTIDKVIPARKYNVEIIVDNKFVFPSRSVESKFTIDRSTLGTEANIIEIIGVDAVVRKAVDLIIDDPNLIIDEDKLVNDIISNTGIGSIDEYYQQFNDAIEELGEEKDVARTSTAKGKTFDSLKSRLEESEEEILELYSGGGSWRSIENIITNDFDVNTNGWIKYELPPSGVSTSNVKVGTGSLYIKQEAQQARYDWALDVPVGHKVYISAWVYLIAKPTVDYLPRLIRASSAPIAAIPINDASLNTWQRASVIGVMEAGSRIRIGTSFNSTGEYYIDGLVAIDLTEEFGENEPTVLEMDEMLSKFPNHFIEGRQPVQTIKEYLEGYQPTTDNPDISDALISAAKNKTFPTVKSRFEESEEEILDLQAEILNLQEDVSDLQEDILDLQGGDVEWQSAENLITNDFDENDAGWVKFAYAPSGISTNQVKVGTGSLYINQTAQAARFDWILDIPVGHKVYISSWAYLIEKPTVEYLPRLNRVSGTPIARIPINENSLNTWQRASVIGVMEDGARIRIGTNFDATGEYYTDGLVVIDLTEEFGEGKEPTTLEMDEMLSKFPNHFIQGRQPVRPIEEDQPPIPSRSIMKPEGVIVPEYVEFTDRTLPFSVGVDDALYGAKKNKIFMSSDALQTTIDGFDFATIKPSNVTWEVKYVTRTHSGYVVVISEVYGDANCRVFFSTSFTDGFTEVYNAPDRFWDVNFHRGGVIDQYGFICGYTGTLDHSFGLYMTKDGGQTWSKVYSTVPVNTNFVAHIHTTQYDPWTGNIFVAVGDGVDNRKFLVSENLGNTWEEIPTPTNEFGWTHLHQPTLVIPCKDKVVLGPDGAPSPCLYSITRDDTVRTTNSHDWGFKFELGISDIANTAQWFPSPVYATTKTRNEVYAIFPQNSPREHYFIVGTGDGGESWHTVYSLTVTGEPTFDMNKGVIGVDSNDFFYAYVFDGTKHYIAKFKSPTWVLSQV